MTAALVAAAVFAVGDWVAVARRAERLEHVCKPATTALLVVAALALDPVVEGRRWWFVAALVLSLAGDVFLMLPGDRFVEGLGSFLLAHVAYVGGFWTDGPSAAAFAVALACVGAAAVAAGVPIVRGARRSDPAVVAPVVVYVAVIAVMGASAWATGIPAAAAGATLFMTSDALIAVNRFVTKVAWAPVAIMVLYHLGQGLLVVSLTSHP